MIDANRGNHVGVGQLVVDLGVAYARDAKGMADALSLQRVANELGTGFFHGRLQISVWRRIQGALAINRPGGWMWRAAAWAVWMQQYREVPSSDLRPLALGCEPLSRVVGAWPQSVVQCWRGGQAGQACADHDDVEGR